MTRIGFFIMCSILISIPVFGDSDAAVSEKGKAVLVKTDRRYYPDEGQYDMTVTTSYENGASLSWRIEIYKKGRDRQSCAWTAPSTMKNNVGMRMNDTMYLKEAKWHKPSIYSYQSVFMDSTFSWGDIMATDIADDYQTTALETEAVDGKDAYKLTLKPIKNGLYAKVEIWVEKNSYNTLKRIYYTVAGQVFKTASYSEIVEKSGKVVSFQVEMKYLFSNMTSVAEVSGITEKKLPLFLFNPDDMSRIKAR